jgi:hypothetical protein
VPIPELAVIIMTRILTILFILIFIIQCRQVTTSRKAFSIEIIIDPVVQVGSDGSSGSFTTDFLWGHSERKYIVNQDSIKVYAIDTNQTLSPMYIDSLSNIESKAFYNYLRNYFRGKGLDTLDIEISSDLDHGMKTIVHIAGDSLPPAKIVDDFAFDPSVKDILRHVDKLVKNKKDRMYND